MDNCKSDEISNVKLNYCSNESEVMKEMMSKYVNYKKKSFINFTIIHFYIYFLFK